MTIYMLTSINLGDVHLNQNSAWPTFEKFLVLHNMLGEKERLRLKMEVHKYFNELRIIEVLGGIPLNPSFDKFIRRRNEQFYIPKIETIFWFIIITLISPATTIKKSLTILNFTSLQLKRAFQICTGTAGIYIILKRW